MHFKKLKLQKLNLIINLHFYIKEILIFLMLLIVIIIKKKDDFDWVL